jgi:hypothetical protein
MRKSLRAIAVTIAAGIGVLAFASPAFAVTKISQASAASQLSAAGVTWSSSGNCTNRNNPTCTSFDQINQSTVSGVITLKHSSGCAINITGGTETGHTDGTYSHWNGYKVDISHNGCDDGYIERFTYIGYIAGWGYQYEAPSGNLYTDEGNHWDILFYTCGC